MTALAPVTPLAWILLLLMAAPPASLDQVKSDPNSEHRARAAVDFAAVAERDAEAAYDKGDMAAVKSNLQTTQDAIELSRQAFEDWGKSASRHPGPYKYAETRSREILLRLNDLENRMDEPDRPLVEAPKNKIQEIHDAWFDAIMEKKK